MRDKGKSLYVHSLLPLCALGMLKLFSYLSEVSVLTHSFYYTFKNIVEIKRPTYPTSHTLSTNSSIYSHSGHRVRKQQSYPLPKGHAGCFWQVTHFPFSREGGCVLQRWVSVNVVCSLVTVLKPLMTLTRSSSSTYC